LAKTVTKVKVVHNHFFEEISKYRAARRTWYETTRERFGAKNERSWALRLHTQMAGCPLTAQPYNNVVRTARKSDRWAAWSQRSSADSLSPTVAQSCRRKREPHAVSVRNRESLRYVGEICDAMRKVFGIYEEVAMT
jgi:hypothetical protein